jgi:solute carrier family 50 protein (sugar transporter)
MAANARGYLGDLNPMPWAFMAGNCLGWLAYAFMRRDYFLYAANAPAMILSIWLNLCAAKLQYSDYRSSTMRHSFVNLMGQSSRRRDSIYASVNESSTKTANDFGRQVLSNIMFQTTKKSPAPQEKLVVGIFTVWMAVLSITFFPRNFSQNTRELIVGIVVNCNLLFFYGAPLSVIFKVIRTRNSASIHRWTMITNTMNGCFWSAYGVAIMDPYVLVPNAIGAALGFAQVALVCMFPRKAKDEVSEAMQEFNQELGPIEEKDEYDEEEARNNPYHGMDQISDPSASDKSDTSSEYDADEPLPTTSNDPDAVPVMQEQRPVESGHVEPAWKHKKVDDDELSGDGRPKPRKQVSFADRPSQRELELWA